MSNHPENPFKNYEDYLAKSPFQTIKLLLPFLPAANQKAMVILIKLLELKYTMEYFKKGNPFSACSNLQEDASLLERVSSIIDFLPPKEQESVEQLISMMSVMEAFQNMTEEESEASEETFPPADPSPQEEDYREEEEPFQPMEVSSDNEESSDITICSNIEF